ncbi:hypothetical protein Y032_0331g2715 [Ancylostoma ceylanicum]|uniref:Uncharacterized protein n=1 Tax=Ancylostoma ceylanicum TaxID=53326 RepID=A0A016RZG6_9BILA|nr:hypothetical protein Y032_0331g2715 [Ancylostoma ceylanicum]
MVRYTKVKESSGHMTSCNVFFSTEPPFKAPIMKACMSVHESDFMPQYRNDSIWNFERTGMDCYWTNLK